MNPFNIALLQLLPAQTLDGNLEKGITACKNAKKMGADIALFPEMWSSGYNLQKAPIALDSPFVNTFKTLAAELSMAIGITILEQFTPSPRNTLVLFDRHGNNVLTYAKVHTCDFGEEKGLTPGDDFYTADLDTAQGVVKIGAMICYDREFPESARILMLKGAELILVPNACPMEINRISQLRARAFENMVGIATVNYPKGKPDCNGHSTVFDGIVYTPGEPCSRDTLVLEAGEAEGIYLAPFSLAKLRAYRNSEVHGNAYRHPHKYQLLCHESVEPPFVRDDYRK